MKKSFTFILCAILSLNIALAQSQTGTAKNKGHVRSIQTNQNLRGINQVSGSIVSTNTYIPGATAILNFTLTFASPDYEYLDGLSMTFPTGMTPIVTGTSDPIATRTGCSTATGQLNPISGQTISWGEILDTTQCGYLNPGTYTFSVAVTVGAITGTQAVAYTVFGDGYLSSATPHTFSGSIQVNQAAANDVGVASTDMVAFYQPAAVVTPKATVKNFGTAAQTFDVSIFFNNGTTNVYSDTVTVTSLASGATQQVTFNTWTAVNGTYTVSTQTLLSGDAVTSNDTNTFNFLVAPTFSSYAWNAYDASSIVPTGPVTLSIPTGQITSLVEDTSKFIAGADFVNNQWFGANSETNSKIYTIDKTTGVKTLVGNSGVSITGLAYDVVTSKLFASVYATTSKLYTINTGTGVATLVAPIATPGIIIGIAANNAGVLYGITLSDSLIAINKTTGATTSIGPLGMNINYAQDIAFDRDNNILYGTLYTTSGILAKISTTTGAATTLATFSSELDGFAIPYTYTLPDSDVMVQSIAPIENGCGLSAAQSITIRVYNGGNNPISNIPVLYTINNGAPVTGTVAGPIAPAAYFDYTFTQTADLSAFGNFIINACTNLANDDNTNNDCNTITVTNIQPSAVPYTMGFETNENVSGWKFQDVNNDGFPWKFSQTASLAHTGTGLALYEYNTDATTAANDWLFTKCINLTAGTNYEITFWRKVGAWQGTIFPEKLKVAIGTAQNAAAMTQVINDLGTINDTVYVKHGSTFTVPTTGTYYIGWYAYSDANEFYIALDDVKIDLASGIENTATDNSINIYPNPAKTQLNISSSVNIENIKVINAIGQQVINKKIDNQFYLLNTSDFRYGVYFIQIETKGGIVTKKFVVSE